MIIISRFFRKEADIIPSGVGTHGLDPIKGLQERNLGNLLEIFAAATPVLEEIAKVKPETWRSMTGLFTALEATFGTTVKKIGEGFLTPQSLLKTRLMNTIEGSLAPIMVEINNIANQAEAWALQNQTGVAIGATIGYIAGFALPGSPFVWQLFGAVYGGIYEQFITYQGTSTYPNGEPIPQLIPDYSEAFSPFAETLPTEQLQVSAAERGVPNRIIPIEERIEGYQRIGGYQR